MPQVPLEVGAVLQETQEVEEVLQVHLEKEGEEGDHHRDQEVGVEEEEGGHHQGQEVVEEEGEDPQEEEVEEAQPVIIIGNNCNKINSLNSQDPLEGEVHRHQYLASLVQISPSQVQLQTNNRKNNDYNNNNNNNYKRKKL